MHGQHDIIIDEEQQVTDENSGNTNSINKDLTPEQIEAIESYKKVELYRKRDEVLKLKREEKQKNAKNNGTFQIESPSNGNKNDKSKQEEQTKLSLIGKVYQGKNGRYNTQYEFAGISFTRAMIKSLNAGAHMKENFNMNLSEVNMTGVTTTGHTVIENFNGVSGFLNAFWLAGTPNKNSSLFTKLRIVGQYFNPANYLLFCSIFLDELVQDLALLKLKKDEAPSVLRMTFHGLFALCSGLQRFVITSACKPLVYAMKNPKIFSAVFAAAAIALNTATYAFRPKDTDDNDTDDRSLYAFYQNIATDIFEKIIVPYLLGGMKGEDHDEYPHGINKEEKDKIVQALTAFLVNYSVVIIASMSSQMNRKGAAFWRGIKVVHESNETRLLDDAGSVYNCMVGAWGQVKNYVKTKPKEVTEADALAAIEAAMGGAMSNTNNISMNDLSANRIQKTDENIQIENIGNINNADISVAQNSETKSYKCCVM